MLTTSGKKRARQIWLIIFCAIIPVFWPILIIMWVKYEKKAKPARANRKQLIQEFASQNGFTYQPRRSGLLTEADQRQFELPFLTSNVTSFEELNGTILNLKFSYLMSSVFVKHTGQNGQDSQFPTILFSIDLPVALPRLFIDSKQNNLTGLDAKALNFVAREQHTLEGDFPDYYSVIAEQNEQIDMYRVLTPEVMQTLIEYNQYDVWINGKQLILLTFADEIRYFAGLPGAFKTASMLMKEIDQIARAMR